MKIARPKPDQPPASRQELNKFIDYFRRHEFAGQSQEERNKILRKRLQKYSQEQLQALLVRGYLDALKSPSQQTVSRNQEKPSKPPGKKPARKQSRKSRPRVR